MGITHLVKAKSGDTYTDQGGNEKESTVTVGRMVETAKGTKMIILECIPFSWLAGGKPVVLYLNAYEKNQQRAPDSAPPPAARTPRTADFDEDIPF
jgi:hypothetical protein